MPFASGQPLVCQGGDRDWLVQEPIVYRGQTEMVEVQLTVITLADPTRPTGACPQAGTAPADTGLAPHAPETDTLGDERKTPSALGCSRRCR